MFDKYKTNGEWNMKALEGKFLVFDVNGDLCRVQNIITSWAARTYQVTNGKLVMVA